MRTFPIFATLAFFAISIGRLFAQTDAPLPRKGTVGLAVGMVSTEIATKNRLKPGQGQVVTRLVPGGTADIAGLKPGDIVLKVNGSSLSAANPLAAIARNLKANESLRFSILRDGKPLVLSASLLERPKQTSSDFEVEYHQVISRGKRIRVITTHPKGSEKFPTVMLFGGIGAYSVDGNFESIAYGNVIGPIAKAGYATIRVEKPGQGDSEGPVYTDLTFEDEFDAYLQGLKFAKTLPYVDARRIGIFGHSMGGVFGPLVASKEPVAAIAVSGTLAKTWLEYSIENARRQSSLAGTSAPDLDQEMKQTAAISTYLYYDKLTPREIVRRHPELKEAMNAMSPDGKSIAGVGIPFFQSVASQNFVKAWSGVTAQALVLWGASDFVSTREDHEMLVEFLNKQRPGSATLAILPESDHGFNQTKTMLESLQKWGRVASPHNPNIEKSLLDWFGKVLK